MTTTPVQVPELVHALSDYLAMPEYHRYVGSYITSGMTVTDPIVPLPDPAQEQRAGQTFCEAERGFLRIASLFHVSESMLAVARLAAVSLDGLECWNREALPANTGAMVFEEPLYIDDIWGNHLAYKAIVWHRAQLKDGPQRGDWATAFTMYCDTRDPSDTINQRMAAFGPRTLGPLEVGHFVAFTDETRLGPERVLSKEQMAAERDRRTKARLAAGEPIAEWRHPLLPEVEVSVNADRIIFAIFALMSETITTVKEFEHRKTTKTFARRGILLPSKVIVIQLRRESQSGRRDPESGRFLLYQAMTRGHWRMQPYGPGRNQLKRIWIHPYMRGDPDGPVHQPTRVTTLSR